LFVKLHYTAVIVIRALPSILTVRCIRSQRLTEFIKTSYFALYNVLLSSFMYLTL